MKKKLLTAAVLTLAAITLVVVSVLSTIAYLTSAARVSNTFTVGNVGIQMFESLVNDQGEKLLDNPNVNGDMKDSNGNTYHLVPGMTYDKDPSVYVTANSDPTYLFVYIQNDIREIEAGNFQHSGNQAVVEDLTGKPTIRQQMIENGWCLYQEGSTAGSFVYYYSTGADADGDSKNDIKVIPTSHNTTEVELFETFTIDGHANTANFAEAQVNVTAYAIQAQGFEGGVDDAWTAIKAAYPNAGTDIVA